MLHYHDKPTKGLVPHETKFHKELAKQYRGRILYQFPSRNGSKCYFMDFYLPEHGVVFEVDDPSHPAKAEADAKRTEDLAARGITVYRCTNEQVDEDVVSLVANMLRMSGILYVGEGNSAGPLTQRPDLKEEEVLHGMAQSRKSVKTRRVRARVPRSGNSAPARRKPVDPNEKRRRRAVDPAKD